jgi:alpha-L-rhamnosidase
LTEEQVKTLEIEALEIRSSVQLRGHFACSDQMVNTIVDMIRRSDLTNLFHYPVDCPHREKNGWTADAALSCEQMLLQMNVEDVHAEWLKTIRGAQNEEGAIPGIVPTGGWGFAWGNGPAWDCVLFWLPYQIYQYRGDRQVLIDNAPAMKKYLTYMAGKRNADGLLEYGLGDWCPTFEYTNGFYKTPLEITDSLTGYDICKKAAEMFGVLKDKQGKAYAENLAKELAAAFRKKWIASNGYAVKDT